MYTACRLCEVAYRLQHGTAEKNAHTSASCQPSILGDSPRHQPWGMHPPGWAGQSTHGSCFAHIPYPPGVLSEGIRSGRTACEQNSLENASRASTPTTAPKLTQHKLMPEKPSTIGCVCRAHQRDCGGTHKPFGVAHIGTPTSPQTCATGGRSCWPMMPHQPTRDAKQLRDGLLQVSWEKNKFAGRDACC